MNFTLFNVARATDSYKATHWKQYPPETDRIYSYFESRGYDRAFWDNEIVFFGLQYFLKQYLVGRVVTPTDVYKAWTRWGAHFSNTNLFNIDGWNHIATEHAGYLPISIKAVPEGTVLGTSNVLMTIENTCPKCYWLPNWLETLLVETWYPCTIASNSRQCKKMIADALEKTGDPGLLPFKLHDFGFRGVTCPEQAALGGAAHLVNFKGTDTFIACDMLMDLYGAEMPGFSIPASEHSTITSWGRENELRAFANMLEQYPTGLVACVSDSYDIRSAVRAYWGSALKEKILSRDGTLVVRPDSGDPAKTVVEVLEGLGEAFGTTTNDKGCKVLPPQIRVIQGDGIDKMMLGVVLDELVFRKWSIDNIAFGSGGGLLQRFDRDTLKFAFKCSYARGEGWEREVYKSPINMPEKMSKRGRLKLIRSGPGFLTVNEDQAGDDCLVEVFRNGELLVDQTLDEIRARAT